MRAIVVSIVVVGVSSLACGGAPLFSAAPRPTQLPSSAQPEWTDPPTPLDDDIVVYGSRGASITVVQYSDWQCGHCRTAFPDVLSAVQSQPSAVLHFRTFPLTPASCTPGDTNDRCTLAAGALCADAEGTFLTYAPAAFASPESVLAELETKTSAWTTCVSDPTTLERVARHKNAGSIDGILGTPTVLVGAHNQWANVPVAQLASLLPTLDQGWPITP